MPKIPRGEKLNMLMRDELGNIIDRTLEFPEGALVTLTRVRTSSDLRYATVFFSLLNGDGVQVLEMLEKNVYHIQQQLNKSLRMRPVPKIRFAIDEEEIRREALEQSLARIKHEEVLSQALNDDGVVAKQLTQESAKLPFAGANPADALKQFLIFD